VVKPNSCFSWRLTGHPAAPRESDDTDEDRADHGTIDTGFEPFGSVHFKSSCGESAASLCLFVSVVAASRLSASFRSFSEMCAFNSSVPPDAPAAHGQVGRRPSISLEAQPLEKLLLDEDFVVARREVRPGIPAG
jgi:hypothetical protein